MHSAPSVSYPVGRSRFLGSLLLVVCLLGCGVTLLWWVQVHPSLPRLVAVSGVFLVATVLAGRSWWRTPSGVLVWDGEHWSGPGTRQPSEAQPDAAIDVQRGLLLHWREANPSRWIWLDRASDPQRWDNLRRAVYSRARPPTLDGAQPPAAKP